MISKTAKTIFLLLAMGLTMLPATREAACDVTPHSDLDPCAVVLSDTATAPGCADAPDHGQEDCCETGCQHCSLPCCSGTAMIPADAQFAEAALTLDDQLFATTTDLTWADPDPLYHPPQA